MIFLSIMIFLKHYDFPEHHYWRGITKHPQLQSHMQVDKYCQCYYLAPGGGCEVLFSPCLSVCVSVCRCVVCVCPANILVFYLATIRRYIDLKCIQDTYGVVLNSLTKIDLHRSKAKVTGTLH